MKAINYTTHGGPDVLTYADVADPEPGPADVVVAVEACGVNRLDIVQRNGWFTLPGFEFPHVAGMDVTGTVAEVGSAVTSVAVGDRVVVDPSLAGVADDSKLAGMGDLHGALGIVGATVAGGYAERCLAPATHVYRVPDHITVEQAATFPTTFLTAAHALFEVAGLSAGETVLIHAAGSGVSVAAIQLARAAGATVLATAGSQAKLDRAAELGVAHGCNNRTTDVAAWVREVTDGRGADVVFDHVGAALFEASVMSLAIGGRLVCCGNTSGDTAAIPSLGFLYHSDAKILGSGPYRPEEFGRVWNTFCEHGFPAIVDAEFALADAAGAHARLEAGDVFGKIVLKP